MEIGEAISRIDREADKMKLITDQLAKELAQAQAHLDDLTEKRRVLVAVARKYDVEALTKAEAPAAKTERPVATEAEPPAAKAGAPAATQAEAPPAQPQESWAQFTPIAADERALLEADRPSSPLDRRRQVKRDHGPTASP